MFVWHNLYFNDEPSYTFRLYVSHHQAVYKVSERWSLEIRSSEYSYRHSYENINPYAANVENMVSS